ncbi:HAD family hydrolase [Mycolicibacterium sp. 018/SC-01/001]|uniref:HAD family hydrolase n=1 Tax=Mycolicibacterium sp. 018/SC-01/001 TaxID=2592069 RepID=UPI0011804315|nr:HAD family hydrolase [Mycolicibacterium sp. 018/SC-01/001]TRW86222.1 HAD family hydrolase [Mycolicibacterium sp. 018/SC-01/001]
MTATTLIASDLDRTLIYSQRVFSTAPPPHTCVEFYNGAPISYMTDTAMRALAELAAQHIVVPATTRTIAQYRRITLPGAPFHFAVTSNGGTILIDGKPDDQWSAQIRRQIRMDGPEIQVVTAALRVQVSDEWVKSLNSAEGLFCYLVVDEDRLPGDFIARWSSWCTARGWRVSRQGRKIYTVPRSLCKSHAVAEVRRRLIDSGQLDAQAEVFAAGDGALDAALLSFADAAIRPAHGELHDLGWTSERVSVTAASGASAADEILTWLHHRAELASTNH